MAATSREQTVDPRAAKRTHQHDEHRPEKRSPVLGVARTAPLPGSGMATAPISGPNNVPMPPSITITIRSPERVQRIIGRADELGVVGQQRAGEPAHRSGDDEGSQLIAEVGKPIARMRRSLEAAPRSTRPKRALHHAPGEIDTASSRAKHEIIERGLVGEIDQPAELAARGGSSDRRHRHTVER